MIVQNAGLFNNYPPNNGSDALLRAFSDWFENRYGVALDPNDNVMPLNGTREGLYNVAMALCTGEKNDQQAAVLLPNPFYQVYMLAAISGGAEPVLVPATEATGHLPDYASVDPAILNRTVAIYICSPANPQGAVADEAYWRALFALAEKHDFLILLTPH